LPARTLGNEYFRHDEDRQAMVGSRSGETFRLGDRVTVKLVEAAPVAGALRFEMISEGKHSSQRRPPRPDRSFRGADNERSKDRNRPENKFRGKKSGKKRYGKRR
jgi:ribonuclease R